MRVVTTIDADGDHQIAVIHKSRQLTDYLATISIFGDFGSGTATIKMSPDGGTTKITQEYAPGSTYSVTADGTINFRSGCAYHNEYEPILYVTLTGSTDPDLTVVVDDNA